MGEVAGGEHGGGAAAEVDAGGWGGGVLEAVFCLDGEGMDELADGGAARGVLVERAVGADAVAEGDVEVEEQGLEVCL